MTHAALAALSNDLVYAAMAVYSCAMVAFAAAVARRAGADVTAPTRTPSLPAREVVAVGAGVGPALPSGASAAAYSEDMGGGSPGPRTGRVGGIAMSLTWLAFCLHLGAVVVRGFAAGRAPWGNMYEFVLTAALASTGVFLGVSRRWPVRAMGVVLVPGVLCALGVAIRVLYVDAGELVPVLRSTWLVIHVAAAILSTGAFTVGALLTVLWLAQSHRERPEPAGRGRSAISWLPAAADLDRMAYRVHAFVFPLWTFAVIAGAIWAENAWATYWNWDPKEVWAFITWVVYAAYLHARATAGWRGGAAAAIALTGYATVLFNLFAVNIFFSGLHSYSGL